MTITFDSIATATLNSPATSLTINSIPNTFTDLRLIIISPTGTGDFLELTFNSATSGFSWVMVGGEGASAFSQRGLSRSKVRVSCSMPSTTNPTYASVDILSYSSSNVNKTLLSFSAADNAATNGEVRGYVGLWQSTNVINSISIFGDGGGNLAAGTIANLYGIKAE